MLDLDYISTLEMLKMDITRMLAVHFTQSARGERAAMRPISRQGNQLGQTRPATQGPSAAKQRGQDRDMHLYSPRLPPCPLLRAGEWAAPGMCGGVPGTSSGILGKPRVNTMHLLGN